MPEQHSGLSAGRADDATNDMVNQVVARVLEAMRERARPVREPMERASLKNWTPAPAQATMPVAVEAKPCPIPGTARHLR